MKAIILAAGRGSRMGDKTNDIPKCLTQLCGKTLLTRQIEALKQAGVEEIGIVRGYMAEKIRVGGMKYFENTGWNETNMLMSLCCAEEWLKSDACIVSYSDIVYADKVISLLTGCGKNIAITYSTNWLDLWKKRFEQPLSDAETFKIDKNHYITEIGSKARSLDEIEGQYMGLLKFTPAGWREVKNYLNTLEPSKINKMDMTSLLSGLIKSGTGIYAAAYGGLWLEVDNENDLKLYEADYKDILC